MRLLRTGPVIDTMLASLVMGVAAATTAGATTCTGDAVAPAAYSSLAVSCA